MEVQPGYWDYERCAWIGGEPTYLRPSSRSAGDVHGLTVPAQPRPPEQESADAGPEVTTLV